MATTDEQQQPASSTSTDAGMQPAQSTDSSGGDALRSALPDVVPDVPPKIKGHQLPAGKNVWSHQPCSSLCAGTLSPELSNACHFECFNCSVSPSAYVNLSSCSLPVSCRCGAKAAGFGEAGSSRWLQPEHGWYCQGMGSSAYTAELPEKEREAGHILHVLDRFGRDGACSAAGCLTLAASAIACALLHALSLGSHAC